VIEKHTGAASEPGWTPAGFHYWQQKERQSSGTDKHSQSVGWNQSCMEINLLTGLFFVYWGITPKQSVICRLFDINIWKTLGKRSVSCRLICLLISSSLGWQKRQKNSILDCFQRSHWCGVLPVHGHDHAYELIGHRTHQFPERHTKIYGEQRQSA